MDTIYEDVRNSSFCLHSDKRLEKDREVFVLQLINVRTGEVDREKRFSVWDDYSKFYQNSVLALQAAPPPK